MSNLAALLEKHGQGLPTIQIQTLKHFIRGTLAAVPAACKFTENLDLLPEMDGPIGDWWDSSLWQLITILNCLLWVLILNWRSLELLPWFLEKGWTSLVDRFKKFFARLTTANVCDSAARAGLMCRDLLEDRETRGNPTLLGVAVSATAQHIWSMPDESSTSIA